MPLDIMLPHRQQAPVNGSARNFSAILLLLGILSSVFACQQTSARDKPWRNDPLVREASKTQTGQAPVEVGSDEPSDRLRIHMNADPGSLHPMRMPSLWARRIVQDNVFETLIRYLADNPVDRKCSELKAGHYEAGLAQSWSVSPGGREIRIRLQENAKFHDGKALSALDVQFSFESAMLKRGGSPYWQRMLADLNSVEIINRHELRFRLERANGFILRALASVPILPEHIYRKRMNQEFGRWIGTGPYRIDKESPESVVLKRNDNYWGEVAKISEVEFVRYADSALALREAKESKMHVVPELIAEHYPEQLNAPGIVGDFQTLHLCPPEIRYLVVNTQRPPFDDMSARRALQYLVDHAAIVEAEKGLFRSELGPIWPGGLGDAESPTPQIHNPEEASRLLELAGWKDEDGDGVRSKEGQRLMITVLATEADSPTREGVLRDIRNAGFIVDQRVGSPAVLKNRLRDGEFDLAFMLRRGESDVDLGDILESGAKENYGRFSDPLVDSLLSQIRSEWQPGGRRSLLRKLSEALRLRSPIASLPVSSPKGIWDKGLGGAKMWNGWFFLRELYWKQDERAE